MRLINTSTLKLEQPQVRKFSYAILSHTWSDDEVSFQEFTSRRPPTEKEGYTKIVNSCDIARNNKLSRGYLWVDTCCIDKSSSAELSESINSMYKWYSDSAICYAYLADVSSSNPDWINAFQQSKWFTRGWTLQELVAPSDVHFYSKEWKFLGTRQGLSKYIAEITSIDPDLLCEGNPSIIHGMLGSFSVARRMSWAAERRTTREEDMAYCLMGIFDINMPLLYGEGQRAFLRLQQEIVKVCNDQSILAWQDSLLSETSTSLFAPHPGAFHKEVNVFHAKPQVPMSLDSRGLELDVDLLAGIDNSYSTSGTFAVLQGHLSHDYLARPAILLDPIAGLEGVFTRAVCSPLFVFRRTASPQNQPGHEESCFAWLESEAGSADTGKTGWRIYSENQHVQFSDPKDCSQQCPWTSLRKARELY